MNFRRFGTALAFLACFLLALSGASADPDSIKHVKTPFRIISDGGTDLRLPPGYILTEEQWSELDKEFHRLQEQETRLKAENESLKDSFGGGKWAWFLGAAGLGIGIAIGALAL